MKNIIKKIICSLCLGMIMTGCSGVTDYRIILNNDYYIAKTSANNAKIFKNIQNEYGSFYKYLLTFTKNKILKETNKTTNDLSDSISKDLIKRGMKFVGSTIIYSYLQATGFIYSHEKECFMSKE